jgi:hypothetical protein
MHHACEDHALTEIHSQRGYTLNKSKPCLLHPVLFVAFLDIRPAKHLPKPPPLPNHTPFPKDIYIHIART